MTTIREMIGIGVLIAGTLGGGAAMAQQSSPTGTTRSAPQPPVETRCRLEVIRVHRRECRSRFMQVRSCSNGATKVSETPVTCIG